MSPGPATPEVAGLDAATLPLEGTRLIEASAGTGKTYTIASLYLRLLLERRLRPGQILVVTYTIAATAELRRRIRERLHAAVLAFAGVAAPSDGDPLVAGLVERSRAAGTLGIDRAHLGAALRGFDEAAIFTIHGFCLRVLEDNAFEAQTAFAPTLVPDATTFYAEVASDFWALQVYEAPELLVRHLTNEKLGPSLLARLAEAVAQNPLATIVPVEDPEAVAAMELRETATAQRFVAAYDAAAALWQAHRAEILATLVGAPDLSRAVYKPATINDRWGRYLDDVMAARAPDVSLRFKAFRSLTPRGLQEGTKKGGRPPQHPFFAACGELWDADQALAPALEARGVRLLSGMAAYARRELQVRKVAQNVQSFDDLLGRLHHTLVGPHRSALAARLRERFPAALIDEFQDTDAQQYAVFRAVYAEAGTLLLIGDPKQAIYGFRGADVFAYVQAKRDVAATYTLGVNYRSDPGYVAALQALYGRVQQPFVYDAIPYVPVEARPGAQDELRGAGAPLRLLLADTSRPDRPREGAGTYTWVPTTLLPALAADVARLLDGPARLRGAPVAPGDVAILCRTNWQLGAVQEALRAVGVPSALCGERSVLKEPEAVELERLLTAVVDPRDGRAIRAALTTTALGVSAAEVLALQHDEAAWDRWVERFGAWRRLWGEAGFMPAFRRLLDDQQVQARLLGLQGGERRLTNLLHLGELLHAAASDRRLSPEALVQWLGRLRQDPAARSELTALGGIDAARLRLESDGDAVLLATVHQSKGLEYPIVYVPFAWQEMKGQGQKVPWVRCHGEGFEAAMLVDLGSPDLEAHRARQSREELAESLRLLYVALTRGVHQVNVVWGALKDSHTSALGYLLHQQLSGTVFDPAAAADVVAHTRLRLDGLGAKKLRQELAELCLRSGGTIELCELLAQLPHRLSRTADPGAAALMARRRRRRSFVPFGQTSFTRLVASPGLGSRAEEGVDHDAGGRAPASSEVVAVAEASAAPIGLLDLPAGARSGLMIHELLEHLDFGADDAVVGAAAAAALRRHGLGGTLTAQVSAALRDVLDTPLHPAGFRLADVPPAQRINELEFVLPAASGGRLDVAGLAAAFADGGGLWEAYAARLHKLGFAPTTGTLKGYVDLVLRHAGRWYVVDYKSNHLGAVAGDYHPDRLAAAMMADHYVLQYHLYTLAVHRHLARRAAGYDYERDFGGVFYLFVRGMAPRHPPGCGVYFDRPDVALLARLERAVTGAAAEVS